jgi:hypothetical protein
LTIVLVAALLAAVLASTGRGERTRVAGADATVGSADSKLPITYQEAQKAGTVGDHDWGDGCDTTRGRIKMPSVYAPPCEVARPGVTGGNSGKGVTPTTIKVVLYRAADDDLSALLSGVSDPVEAQNETANQFITMLSGLMNTWGRKVETVVVKGRGSNETDARADAVKVAEEIGAFASIGGPQQETAYAEELANRGVLCISCVLSAPNSFYQKHAPYIWGSGQTPEEYLPALGEITIGMLNGGKATFAGDAATRAKTRVFGSVNFEQDPPVFGDVGKRVAEIQAKRGMTTAVRLTYQLVIPELGEKARSIIGQLKDAGVTTVVFLGDPIMPIYLTKEATNQNYFPEWIISGTVFTDTTVFGRQYDQKQWAHAFGMTGLPVPQTVEQGEGYRIHQWYFGTAPAAPKLSGVLYDPIRLLMLGIHLAGPDLTPETFRDGLFRYPPSGGTPIQPRISFGDHGVFSKDPEVDPGIDYLAVDDLSLIWYDPDATGVDEQGKEGTGMMRHVDGGKRYLPGDMPKTDAWIQNPDGTVLNYDQGYPGDETPTYPSPGPGG